MDWMELKRYENAREEFALAIVEEPKNLEARYQIALSYKLEGSLLRSVDSCAEILSIDAHHRKAEQLLTDIVSVTRSQLAAQDASALAVLRALMQHNLVQGQAILKTQVIPLLRSGNRGIVDESFRLLKVGGLDVDGLTTLANDSDRVQREKALRLVENNADRRYQVVLGVLVGDGDETIKERAALLLLERYDDNTAKLTLAEIYHVFVRKQIDEGRAQKEGLELNYPGGPRLSEIAAIAPKLGDPSFAGEFAELLCNGRVYGLLADGLMDSASKMGRPALPYLEVVLTREAEHRRLLEGKGFRNDQIAWRFQRLRQLVDTLSK
jgi:hypothetical protein